MSGPSDPPKVKITDLMITAGARVLSDLTIDLADGFVSPDKVAEAVFLAMREAEECADEDL